MLRKLLSITTLLCYMLTFIARDVVSAVQEPLTPSIPKNILSSCIPPLLGRITSMRYAGSDLVVVAIQDLHCHAEVQHNIAGILSFLGKEYRLDRVFVEGASGNVNMSWLAKLQEKAEGREMLDTLMAQGKLTGAESFALQNGRKDILYGLENEELYQKNFERLITIRNRRDIYEERVSALKDELSAVKNQYFSRQHNSFDALIDKYRTGSLSEDKFYRLLRKYADRAAFMGDTSSVPDVLKDYRKVKHEAKNVRFNRAVKELRWFLDETKNRLPYDDYRTLEASCRTWADQPLFTETLFHAAQQCQININKRYPDLYRFAQYVEKNRGVNPLELIKEQDRLIHEVRAGLSRDRAELEVSFLCDFLPLFEGYFLDRLSPDEYARFQRLFPEFCLFWEKYTGTPLGPWEDDYALLNAFYDTNIQRNKCFIETLTRESQLLPSSSSVPVDQNSSSTLRHAKRVVAVVTGGFHTDGMETLLAERGISCLTVTPSVTAGVRAAASTYDEMMTLQAAAFNCNAFAMRLLAQETAAARNGIMISAEVDKASREAERGLAGLFALLGDNYEETFTTMCVQWNTRGPGAYPDIFGPIEFGGMQTDNGKRYGRFIDKKTRQILTFEVTPKGEAVFTGVDDSYSAIPDPNCAAASLIQKARTGMLRVADADGKAQNLAVVSPDRIENKRQKRELKRQLLMALAQWRKHKNPVFRYPENLSITENWLSCDEDRVFQRGFPLVFVVASSPDGQGFTLEAVARYGCEIRKSPDGSSEKIKVIQFIHNAPWNDYDNDPKGTFSKLRGVGSQLMAFMLGEFGISAGMVPEDPSYQERTRIRIVQPSEYIKALFNLSNRGKKVVWTTDPVDPFCKIPENAALVNFVNGQLYWEAFHNWSSQPEVIQGENMAAVCRHFMSIAGSLIHRPEDISYYGAALLDMSKQCTEGQERMLESLESCAAMIASLPWSFKEFFQPLIYAQKNSAASVLKTVSSLWETGWIDSKTTREDLRFFRDIVVKQNKAARDVSIEFFLKGVRKGIISVPLHEARNSLEAYFEASRYPLLELYEKFRAGNDEFHSLKKRVVNAHQALLNGDGKKAGSLIDGESLLSLIQFVFPTGKYLGKKAYSQTMQTMIPRPQDIAGIPEDVREMNVSVAPVPGKDDPLVSETLKMYAPWMKDSIRRINNFSVMNRDKRKADKQSALLGTRILRLSQERKLKTERARLFEELYRLHVVRSGQKLPILLSSENEYRSMNEFLSVTLKALIADCVSHAPEFGSYVEERTRRKHDTGKGMALVSQELMHLGAQPGEEEEQRTRVIVEGKLGLRGHSMDDREWHELRSAQGDPERIRAVIASIIERSAVSLARDNTAELIAGGILNVKFQRPSDNTRVVSQETPGKGISVRFRIDKSIPFILLNQSICTWYDEVMWNNPDFFVSFIIDDQDIARGGVQFLSVREDGNKFLVMTGINPSPEILERVSASDLYGRILDHAALIADRTGCSKVLIPEDKSIYTENQDIGVLIINEKYRVMQLKKKYEFCSKKEYAFSRCYVARDIKAKGKIGTGTGSIPLLKHVFTQYTNMSSREYDRTWGPIIEEILFTGVPIAMASFMPSMFIPIIAGARLVFILLHLFGARAPAGTGTFAVISILTVSAVFLMPHSFDSLPLITACAAFIHLLVNNRSDLDRLFYYGPFSRFPESDKRVLEGHYRFISQFLFTGIFTQDKIDDIVTQLHANTLPANAISLYRKYRITPFDMGNRIRFLSLTAAYILLVCALELLPYIFVPVVFFQNLAFVIVVPGLLLHLYDELIRTHGGALGITHRFGENGIKRFNIPPDEIVKIFIPPLDFEDDTVFHECIHALNCLGYLPYDMPMASAFGSVAGYRSNTGIARREVVFLEGQVSGAYSGYLEGKMDRLICRYFRYPMKDMWRSFITPDKEYDWTYNAGALIGGYAQGLSERTGNPDDAWEYLRMLSFGISPEIAEDFLCSRKDALQGDNDARARLFEILEKNEEAKHFTKLAFSILSKDEKSDSLIASYLEERRSHGKAVIPSLKKVFISRFPGWENKYENGIAPIIEEAVFTGIPLIAGVFMPGLFPVLYGVSRVIFVLLHLRGNNDGKQVKRSLQNILFMPAVLSACLLTIFSFVPFVPFVVILMGGSSILLHMATNAFIHPWVNKVFGTQFLKADIGGRPSITDLEHWDPYFYRIENLAGIEFSDDSAKKVFEEEMKPYLTGFLHQAFANASPVENDLMTSLDKLIVLFADTLQSSCPRWREKGIIVKYPEKFTLALVEAARMAARRECGIQGDSKSLVPNLPDGFGLNYSDFPGFRMALSKLYRTDMSLSDKYEKEGLTIALVLRDMKDGLGDLTKMELLIEQLPPLFALRGIKKVNYKIFALSDDEERMRKLMSRFKDRHDVSVTYVTGTSKKMRIPDGHLKGVDLLFSIVWPVNNVVEYPASGEEFVPVCMTLGDYNRPNPVNLATKPDVMTRNVEIPTGFGGLGFYVDPRVAELKRRVGTLGPEQRREEKKETARALVSEIGSATHSDVSHFNGFAEPIAGSRWALIYLHYTANFYIRALYQKYRAGDLGKEESITLFTFFSSHNVHDPGRHEREQNGNARKDEFAALQSQVNTPGMEIAEFYDLSQDLGAIDKIDFSRPGIRVINFGVRSYPLFLKVMALSDLPVGVTGDESLLAALILGKPFVYEFYKLKQEMFEQLLRFFGNIRGGEKVAQMLKRFKDSSEFFEPGRSFNELGNNLLPDAERDTAFNEAGNVIADERVYEGIASLSLKLLGVNGFFDRMAARYSQEPEQVLPATEQLEPETAAPRCSNVMSVMVPYSAFLEMNNLYYFKHSDIHKKHIINDTDENYRNDIINYFEIRGPYVKDIPYIVSREGKVVEVERNTFLESRPLEPDKKSEKEWDLWQQVSSLGNTPSKMFFVLNLAMLFLAKLGTTSFEKCDTLFCEARTDIAGSVRTLMKTNSYPWSVSLVIALSEFAARNGSGAKAAALHSDLSGKVIYDVYAQDDAASIRDARRESARQGLPRIGITFLPRNFARYAEVGRIIAVTPGHPNGIVVPVFLPERFSGENVEIFVAKPEGMSVEEEYAYLGAVAAATIEELTDNYYLAEVLRINGKFRYLKSSGAGFNIGAVITTEPIFRGMTGSLPWRNIANATVIIDGKRSADCIETSYHPSSYQTDFYTLSPGAARELMITASRQKKAEQFARGYILIVAMNEKEMGIKQFERIGSCCSVLIRDLSPGILNGRVLPDLLANSYARHVHAYGGFRIDGVPGNSDRETILKWIGPKKFYGVEIDLRNAKGLEEEHIADWLRSLAETRPEAPFMVRVPKYIDGKRLRHQLYRLSITIETEVNLDKSVTGDITAESGQTVLLSVAHGETWNTLRSLKGGPFIVELNDLARGTLFDKTYLAVFEHIRMIVALFPDNVTSLTDEAWNYGTFDLPGAQDLEPIITLSQYLNSDAKVTPIRSIQGPAGLRLRNLNEIYLKVNEEDKRESRVLLAAFSRALSERMLFEQWVAGKKMVVDPDVDVKVLRLFASALYGVKCTGGKINNAEVDGVKLIGGSVTVARAISAAKNIIDTNPAEALRILEPFIDPRISVTNELKRLKMNEIKSILSAA